MTVQSVSKKIIAGALPLALAANGLCGNVEIYPYEPVLVRVPHQAAHLDFAYGAEAVAIRPGAP
jgi:hypothetical protein